MLKPLFQAGIKLTFAAQLLFSTDGESLIIQSTIHAPHGQEYIDPVTVSLPLRYFHDAKGEVNTPLLEGFCQHLSKTIIPETVDIALFRDFTLHVYHMARLTAITAELSDETFEDVFPELTKFQTSVIMASLKQMVGYESSGKGRHANWTSEALFLSIVMAMRKLRPEHRTYPLVAKQLKEDWKERAPKSAAALKKVVSRYNLQWDVMKNTADFTGEKLLETLPPRKYPESDAFFQSLLMPAALPTLPIPKS